MSQIRSVFFFGIVIAFIAFLNTSQVQAQIDNNRFEVSKQLDIYNALLKEVEMFYVDSVETDKIVRRGIDAMLKGLDPYTEYYPDVEDFKFQLTGEYGGIGAFIRKVNEGVVITEPIEGQPAQSAGLKAGDIILSIDTANVLEASSERVSELLKGTPGSKVTLSIKRPGEKKPLEVEIVRKQVVMEQLVPYYGVQGKNTGYIYLNRFTDKSAQEVKAAFEDLRQNHRIESLILDLRNNGGGVLDGAVQIVNMFVPKGREVLSMRGKIRQRDRVYRTSIEPIDTIIPIAVLINGGSASASEILCGALQDMDRAVLVGQRSFGKGLVQSSRDLPYNGLVKITMSKYYIPSGRCIQHIDYSHRTEDGSAAAIPDSLTAVFYTSKGRPVRDGGGVSPDFAVEEEKTPTMMYYLINDSSLFNYVTQWTLNHETIPPVEDFVYSDEDYVKFKTYLKERNFTYDRQSEKALKNLKEIADLEGFMDEDSTIFAALEAKLMPNLDRDLERYKDQIKQIISVEIIKRYYYQRGELIESLKGDTVLKEALRVLEDKDLYRKTLSAPVPEK
ncbi:MAG: S41 family peptidase, partial [Tannerella sp.]|nr:S41 family peptidase [Tannerella sp.]